MVALQGKNYVYSVKSLFMPINVDGCHIAASKTKKNVLITLQVSALLGLQTASCCDRKGCSPVRAEKQACAAGGLNAFLC